MSWVVEGVGGVVVFFGFLVIGEWRQKMLLSRASVLRSPGAGSLCSFFAFMFLPFIRLLDFFFFGFACLLAVVCCSFASCFVSLLPRILSDITSLPCLLPFLANHACNKNQPFHRRVLSPIFPLYM